MRDAHTVGGWKTPEDGDDEAWCRFVERILPVVFAAVRRVFAAYAPSSPEEEVEDAVQDVFLALLEDDRRLLRSFDPDRASLPTYLTLVARSRTIDRLRRRRPPTLPLEEAPEPAAAEPEAAPEIPLHLLTGRQALVLRLLHEEGLSVREAAQLLGVEEQTVRSSRHKALERLRKGMKKNQKSRGCSGNFVRRTEREEEKE